MYRRTILAGVGLLLVAPLSAKAQVIIDMSLITCQRHLAAPPDQQKLTAWWMRGYFSAAKNLSMIDFRYVEYNTKASHSRRRHRGPTRHGVPSASALPGFNP